ncbi:hypothetical protein DVH24_021589, partial [Malus domestica]
HKAFWELTGLGFHRNSEVKRVRAKAISGWVTYWEKQNREGVVEAQSIQYRATTESSSGCGRGPGRDMTFIVPGHYGGKELNRSTGGGFPASFGDPGSRMWFPSRMLVGECLPKAWECPPSRPVCLLLQTENKRGRIIDI